MSSAPAPFALVGHETSESGETDEVAYLLPSQQRVPLRAGLIDGYGLEFRSGTYFAIRVKHGKVTAQAELSDLEPAHRPTTFRNYLGWFDKERVESDDESATERRVMRWQRLGDDAKPQGEPQSLTGAVPHRVDLCAFEQGGGALFGRHEQTQIAWFLGDDGWSQPVEAELPPSRRGWGPYCRDGRLERTWILGDTRPMLGTLVCTPNGCELNTGAAHAGLDRWRRAAVLGDRVVAYYEATTDDHRVQVAPIDELAQSPPVVVVDSVEYSGPKLENQRVLVGKSYALVHFDDEEDHHAIALESDDSVNAVAVDPGARR